MTYKNEKCYWIQRDTQNRYKSINKINKGSLFEYIFQKHMLWYILLKYIIKIMILDHLNSNIYILSHDKLYENKTKFIKIHINIYIETKTLFS